MRALIVFLLGLGMAWASPSRAEETFLLRNGQRVVFLGDSNTFAGTFIAYLEGYLVTRFPDQRFELINLGLPSETVSGLSEPDHPYPRPDIHERLERALTKSQPNLVVACYGMNDGIYHPFSEARLEQYRKGILDIVERIQKTGARVILMTPVPFDAPAIRAKLLPLSGDRFSWMKPYEDYDGVLARYSAWLLTLRDRGLMVVDSRSALVRHLAAMRKGEPKYVVSGDGIHPNPMGHWMVAQSLLSEWKAPALVDVARIDLATKKVVAGHVSHFERTDSGATFRWMTKIPMPYDVRWDKRMIEDENIRTRWNSHRLQISGAAPGSYSLLEKDHIVGTFNEKQLAEGVDLLSLKDLSSNRRATELGPLVAQRERLLGLAWLTDVGHKRPDTPRGKPLPEAQAEADRLEKRIRALATPVTLELLLKRTP